MIGLGYWDLHPDDVFEVEDRRHPLRGEQVIVQVCCEVGVDGALLSVELADIEGETIGRLADLEPRLGEVLHAILAREVERQTALFYALPDHEQRRRLAAKDTP